MVDDPCVHLTIMHVVSKKSHDSDIEGNAVHATSHHLNVQYLKKVVSVGTDTSMLVFSMASQYDLFIVGKRFYVIDLLNIVYDADNDLRTDADNDSRTITDNSDYKKGNIYLVLEMMSSELEKVLKGGILPSEHI
ncbi:hypothetical protein LINPERHAP2_LOCUS29767 [Linum perenne]